MNSTSEFWKGTKAGELRFVRCRSCGHPQHMGPTRCVSCLGTDLEWCAASGRGKVVTLTVVHRAPYAKSTLPTPYTLALIELEEGPRMMAHLHPSPPPSVGSRVQIDWPEASDETDFVLPTFRVVES